MQIPSPPNLKLFFNLSIDNNKTDKKSFWSEPTAQSAFAQLQPQSMSSSRKAAAKQKIAELKMRLEAMMKFAGIGKGNPAEAIRLAKELSAAIRAYGGGGGGVTTPSMPQLTSTAGSAEAGVVATANSDNFPAQAKEAAAISDAPTSVLTDIQAAEQSAKDALAQVSAVANGALAQGISANSDLSDEDRAFLVDAKTLMGRIKVLIALETKKAEDEKKGREAVAEMEKSLSDAPQGLAVEHATIAESAIEYSAAGMSLSPAGESGSVSISV